MQRSLTYCAVLLAGSALLNGCVAGDEGSDDATTDDAQSVTLAEGLDAEERVFLEQINAHRAQNGRQPVQVSVDLTAAADFHSKDLASKNYFSHTSQNGKSPFDRMCDAGYCASTWKAENIAAGSEGGVAVFGQWKGSAGHNQNMLAAEAKVIGIGRAFDAASTYKWYWTTTFGGFVDEVMGAGGGTTPDSNRLADGDYVIKPVVSGKCLDINGGSKANGAIVQQWQCNGSGAQVFRLASLDGGFYKIVNPQSGKALDIRDASVAAGAQLLQWDYTGGQNQQFQIDRLANGEFTIRARHSGLVLDVKYSSTADGTPIHQWSSNGSAAQRWTFQKSP